MVGVQMESVGGHQYPPRSLTPQNGSGSAGPENLLKIVSCAEAEDWKNWCCRSKWNRWVAINIHLDHSSLLRKQWSRLRWVPPWGANFADLAIGFVQDVVDLLEDVLDLDVSSVGSSWRIWAKLSIVAFLFFSRASSRKIFIGSPPPSSFFPSTMGGCLGCEVELLIP